MAVRQHKPYYAVIFSSQRSKEDEAGYQAMAERMFMLAQKQAGYLGFESVRDQNGSGISVSYWKDKASIKAWKDQTDHLVAQGQGRSRWYTQYKIRIAIVKNEYGFKK